MIGMNGFTRKLKFYRQWCIGSPNVGTNSTDFPPISGSIQLAGTRERLWRLRLAPQLLIYSSKAPNVIHRSAQWLAFGYKWNALWIPLAQ